MSSSIYTVTTFRDSLLRSPRCVGWFHDPQRAQACVERNDGNIHEDGYYTYAVVEEVNEGLYPDTPTTWFYEWSYKTKRYEAIVCPERFKDMINFGIG